MSNSRTLCIVLNEFRGANVTHHTLRTRLAGPLRGSLAFSGAKLSGSTNPYNIASQNEWVIPEPTDWMSFLESVSPTGIWRNLAIGSPNKAGDWGPLERDLWKSGLIGLWFKSKACDEILERNLDHYFDWFCFVRSDFFWELDAPGVETLKQDRLYVLEGEEYGGVNDRFALVHKSMIQTYGDLANSVFRESEVGLLNSINLWLRTHGKFNPESFWKMMLEEAELGKSIVKLPYLGYAIRTQSEKSRWSEGFLWEERGYFVKYPTELLRLLLARKFLRKKSSVIYEPRSHLDKLRKGCINFMGKLAGKFPRGFLFPLLKICFGVALVKTPG